jgi:cystathionine beta-lyase/cystathionine gamma-synthase
MNEGRFNTRAVHAGDVPDPTTGALDPPVVLASAFAFADAAEAAGRFDGSSPGMIYSRWRNPTVEALERKVASLEGAEDCVALASGMAAVHGALTAFLESGDHVIAPSGIYAETARLVRGPLARFGVRSTFVDTTDLAAVRAAIDPRTRVIYAETPANPTLAISDLRALADLAHECGAKLVVDSTFATPFHQRPVTLGADLALHSATKALCGHGDAVGGVVSGRREDVQRVREQGVRTCGGAMAPFSAMLIARGIRTLGLRMERASSTALELAKRLAADTRIERVAYPGLPSHPGHELAAQQMDRGFGALVAFEVRGGLPAGARAYDAVRVIARAVSLGDVRSLLTHPASTTHASLTPEQRRDAGLGEGLLRLSVGIEDVEDLWEDLDRALG